MKLNYIMSFMRLYILWEIFKRKDKNVRMLRFFAPLGKCTLHSNFIRTRDTIVNGTAPRDRRTPN